MANYRQASKHTPYGLSFYNPATDAMWANAPHPAILPPSVGFAFVDDFVPFLADAWTVTAVENGTGNSTIAQIDGEGGIIRVNTAANEDDGAQAQLSEMFKFASGNRVWFEARVNLTDEATQSDAFVGLATTDTTIIASAPDDRILFHKDDGDTNWDFVAAKGGTGTSLTGIHTAAADTWVVFGFYFDGSTIQPYVNGVKTDAVSTNIPDNEELALSFGYLNGAGTAQNEGMNLDWIRCVSIYDRS